MKALFFVFASTVLAWSQPNFNAVIKAIQTGNATTLAEYMDNNVEITIKDKDGVYQKTEATSIVEQFFSSNRPSTCRIVHSGSARDHGSFYCIGNLVAGGKKHRVYLYFKENSGKYLIQEMRFEEN